MKSEFIKFFKGKKILVTGHTGFKGSWLSIWLNELGAKVIGYALDPYTEKDNFVLSGISSKIIDIRGDIRDYDKLLKAFKKYKPDIVFHMAAQPLVKYSYDHPKYTYEVNVMGTVNILEMIRLTSETKIGIIITSDKCYQNNEWVWGYRETDPLGGYDPYSSSKGCAEMVVSSYRNAFFNPERYDEHKTSIATVRAGNVIGGGDWSINRIIPDCVRSLESYNTIEVRNPEAIRPWQHVLEPLRGYLLLTTKMLEDGIKYSQAWNFGPNQDSIITVKKLVERLLYYWGEGNYNNIDNDNSYKSEARLLNLDINKARINLGWTPKWTVDKSIQETVSWYKNYIEQDIYQLCVDQIENYCTDKSLNLE